MEYEFNDLLMYFAFGREHIGPLAILKHIIDDTSAETIKIWLKDSSILVARAAEVNRLDILQYLHSLGCKMYSPVYIYAEKHNNIEMLKWGMEIGANWGYSAAEEPLKHAVASGKIEMVKCMLADGKHQENTDLAISPFDESVHVIAATHGHLEYFQWVTNTPYADSISTVIQRIMRQAIRGEHVEICKWICTHYGEADASIHDEKWIHEACFYGAVGILEWLHQQHPNRQYSAWCCEHAATQSKEDSEHRKRITRQWLHAHDCKCICMRS
jgi:hypothetical protein